MEKLPRLFFMFLFLLCMIVVFLLADTLFVKIKSTFVRIKPKFYADGLAQLKAGDSVETISVQNGWMKIRTADGVIGWIHSGAVEEKKFKLFALDKSLKTQASASEVALAGKGFNKNVEESYRKKNPAISFAYVDKMLEIKIPPRKIEEFLRTGRLGEFRGAK